VYLAINYKQNGFIQHIMPGKKKTSYRFDGIVERFPDGFKYFFVRVAFSVEELFGTRGSIRMTGKLNGIDIDRGLMPDGNGGHFIILGGELRKKAGLKLGSTAHFELWLHETPDDIVLPEEMEAAFEMEPEGRIMYEKMTPGLQRSVLTYITSAKTPETRAKRAAFLLERFLSGYYLRGKHKEG
jgi:hypothetical protein